MIELWNDNNRNWIKLYQDSEEYYISLWWQLETSVNFSVVIDSYYAILCV